MQTPRIANAMFPGLSRILLPSYPNNISLGYEFVDGTHKQYFLYELLCLKRQAQMTGGRIGIKMALREQFTTRFAQPTPFLL